MKARGYDKVPESTKAIIRGLEEEKKAWIEKQKKKRAKKWKK